MTPTPVRQEYEVQLEPLLSVPVERNLPLAQRLWQHGWLRKAVILVVIAALWEAIARYQGNDLLLRPSCRPPPHCGTGCSAASCRPRSVCRW